MARRVHPLTLKRSLQAFVLRVAGRELVERLAYVTGRDRGGEMVGVVDARCFGATRLDRLTWFAIGLDVGIIAAGVTAVLMAWRFTRNVRAFGGGLGVVVQGLGLLVLDLTFASILVRLV